MFSKTLPLLRQVLQGVDGRPPVTSPLLEGGRVPGALALQRPLRLPLLAGGPQQTATRLAKVAFHLVSVRGSPGIA